MRVAVTFTMLVTAAACSAGSVSRPGNETPASSSDPQETASSGAPLALVVIDTQKVFFDTAKRRNTTIDVNAIMEKTAHLFQVAGQKQIPVIITFEASKTG